MKVSGFVFLLVLHNAVGDSEDHHTDEYPECTNVTDVASCEAHCGQGSQAMFKALSPKHADTVEGLHVDALVGFDCLCGGGGAGQNCTVTWDEPPTCESVGLGECEANATTTCADYCTQLGLVDDNHFCIHHEGEEHDHRLLAEGEMHDSHEEGEDHEEHHEEPHTVCYCKSTEEGEGLLSCGDEGWEGEHEEHPPDEKDTRSAAVGLTAASSALVAIATVITAAF
uniref:Uncharacterized protein n=1 Tax=Pseudictyota dubia TaxID=2749911 RepID=A0A7R9ZD92_9STRA|mmetsp:Transcript_38417/g.70966  ORF Transcript_38417/g.70966 Transcript_38417/m.70966 type:complete len:226 (+) Transcript_38417:130-807(+)